MIAEWARGLHRKGASVTSINVVEIPDCPFEVIGQAACVEMLRSGSICAASMSAKLMRASKFNRTQVNAQVSKWQAPSAPPKPNKRKAKGKQR